MCNVQCVWCECVRMSMCEHMHNDVHITRMYKGERVGPYLSHSFVDKGGGGSYRAPHQALRANN